MDSVLIGTESFIKLCIVLSSCCIILMNVMQENKGLGRVVHTYNLSYSGGGNRDIPILGQCGQKIVSLISKTAPTLWYTPVIPATWEAELRG
jgi:hypothetical protein